MPTDFSVKPLPATPVPMKATQSPTAPLVRQIAPLKTFDVATGEFNIASDSPWGREAETESKPAAKPEAKPEQDRAARWKAEQAEKREEKQAKQHARQAEKQALARDLLFKGDVASAAQALGMTPTDFLTYIDNARLQIPNRPEEQTPQQKQAEAERVFREERLKFEAEQKDFQRQVITQGYIRDKIAPVLSDSVAYEMIHQVGLPKMTKYIYDYMDQHYQETKEELSARDVADAVEENLLQIQREVVERSRGVKKLANLFGPGQGSGSGPGRSGSGSGSADSDPELDGLSGSELEDALNARAPQSRHAPQPRGLGLPSVASLQKRNPSGAQPDSSAFETSLDDEAELMNSVADEPEQPSYQARRGTGSRADTPFALRSRDERLLDLARSRR